jgi:hypothetical protein
MDTVANNITKPVHRLEVFTGAGRRWTWGDEDKARIVAEMAVSEESVSAVARRHGLSPQQLFAGAGNCKRIRLRFRMLKSCSLFQQSWMWYRLRRPSDGNAKCHVARLSPVQE